jgi:hypothetical protein
MASGIGTGVGDGENERGQALLRQEQERELLRDHSAHGDAHQVHLPARAAAFECLVV